MKSHNDPDPSYIQPHNPNHTHLECISDFCGNYNNPGHWADIFQNENGQKYIKLGGNWTHYHQYAPTIINQNDHRFNDFIKACNVGYEIQFVKNNWTYEKNNINRTVIN